MASFVTSTDIAQFRARVLPFLLSAEAENNLLFGIMHGIAGGRYRNPLLGYLEDAGQITAVAIRTPPHSLVLSAAPVGTSRELATLIDPDLPGVNAPADQAAAFAETWRKRTGRDAKLQTALRIYALRAVRPPTEVPGRPRPAGPNDAALLTHWMTEFAIEALGPDDPNAAAVPDRVAWLLGDPDSGFVLWESEGQPVSFAGYSGPTPNGMRVGPVYTPPVHRRRGYAGACVADLSARQLAAGRRFCFLYTDLSNPTSNSVYRRIGYEPVCDAAMYRFSA